MPQRINKNRSAATKPQKPNNYQGTPHSIAIKKMAQQYETNCDRLSEKILQLDLVNDARTVKEVQVEITAKTAKLAEKIAKKRPHLDRQVLRYEIEKLETILKVKKILLEIADTEMRLAGMKLNPESPEEDVQTLKEKISVLRKKLPFVETMSDEQKSALQKEINTLRAHLGEVLWSLMQYEDELDSSVTEYMELTKKTLNLTPSMGNIKKRGQSGLDLGR